LAGAGEEIDTMTIVFPLYLVVSDTGRLLHSSRHGASIMIFVRCDVAEDYLRLSQRSDLQTYAVIVAAALRAFADERGDWVFHFWIVLTGRQNPIG
jgi:hypothetical protein